MLPITGSFVIYCVAIDLIVNANIKPRPRLFMWEGIDVHHHYGIHQAIH